MTALADGGRLATITPDPSSEPKLPGRASSLIPGSSHEKAEKRFSQRRGQPKSVRKPALSIANRWIVLADGASKGPSMA